MIRLHTIDEDLKTRATIKHTNDIIEYNNLKMDLPYIPYVEKAVSKINHDVDLFKHEFGENKKYVRGKINKIMDRLGDDDDESKPNSFRVLKTH